MTMMIGEECLVLWIIGNTVSANDTYVSTDLEVTESNSTLLKRVHSLLIINKWCRMISLFSTISLNGDADEDL